MGEWRKLAHWASPDGIGPCSEAGLAPFLRDVWGRQGGRIAAKRAGLHEILGPPGTSFPFMTLRRTGPVRPTAQRKVEAIDRYAAERGRSPGVTTRIGRHLPAWAETEASAPTLLVAQRESAVGAPGNHVRGLLGLGVWRAGVHLPDGVGVFCPIFFLAVISKDPRRRGPGCISLWWAITRLRGRQARGKHGGPRAEDHGTCWNWRPRGPPTSRAPARRPPRPGREAPTVLARRRPEPEIAPRRFPRPALLDGDARG